MSLKTLAIVISCHGMIPINFDYGKPKDDVFSSTVIPFSYFNIKDMASVTLSKLGGICFSDARSNNIMTYVAAINSKKDLLETEGVKNTDELVNYLFSNKPKLKVIKDINDSYFTISFPPIIKELTKYTLEKIYTPLYDSTNRAYGGVAYLSSNGFTGKEEEAIKNKLKDNNAFLYANKQLHKSQILDALKEFKIDKLYFIDFTCSAYQNILPVQLNEDAVKWLNGILEHDNITGGKFIAKNKKKIKHKNKTNNKKLKKTKITRRKFIKK